MLLALIDVMMVLRHVVTSGRRCGMGGTRRIILGTGLAAAFGLVAMTGYLGYQQSVGNFHTVVDGEVYRSGQMTPVALAEVQGTYGIRSILNLRGAYPGEAWYDAEVAEAARLGIAHVDFEMNASIQLSDPDAGQLIALMREMPKPLLVHCRHGSDRTGLAMSLYMAAIGGSDDATAEGQLSLWYGHFSVPMLSDAWPMDESWERLEKGFGFVES
jgi:protein tyrosine/serine phosphatase